MYRYKHPIYITCPKCNQRVHSEFGDCLDCKAKELFKELKSTKEDRQLARALITNLR